MNLLQNFQLAVIFVPWAYGFVIHFYTFTQCAPETTNVGQITQNKRHFAVQGHLRSPISKAHTVYESFLL